MPDLPHLPPSLTPADWSKHKAPITKVIGNTNVTPAVEKLKATYDDVDPAAFRFPNAFKKESEIDEAEQKLRAEMLKLAKLRQAVEALSKAAAEAAKKLKGDKLVPKSSAEHVQKIVSDVEKSDRR